MDRTNVVILFFILSPVILFIASVSSVGLFKLRRWGRFLAIIALTLYLIIFSALMVTQIFPTYFDSLSYAGRGWFIFYHMNIKADTFVVPLIAVFFLVLFNMKFFRQNYRR